MDDTTRSTPGTAQHPTSFPVYGVHGPSMTTAFCVCGCGQAVEHVPSQLTYRHYATATCAARALAKRLGYTSRVGAANTAPTTTQTEDGAMAKKGKTSTKKATRTRTPTEYTTEKLKVQGQCKVGSTAVYHGPKAFDGKKVKVTGHESRGGVFIEVSGKPFTVSPYSLLGRPAKPKATKPAKPAPGKATKRRTGRTSKAAPSAPEKAAPAPQPAASATPPATGKAKPGAKAQQGKAA